MARTNACLPVFRRCSNLACHLPGSLEKTPPAKCSPRLDCGREKLVTLFPPANSLQSAQAGPRHHKNFKTVMEPRPLPYGLLSETLHRSAPLRTASPGARDFLPRYPPEDGRGGYCSTPGLPVLQAARGRNRGAGPAGKDSAVGIFLPICLVAPRPSRSGITALETRRGSD